MKRLLLLLACLLALCTTVVAAEPAISDMKTDCTLTGSGACQVTQTFTMEIDGAQTQLRFPLVPGAKKASVAGCDAQKQTDGDCPVLVLSDASGFTGTRSFTVLYTVSGLVSEADGVQTLQLPLLSAKWAYPICVLYKIRKHGEACLPGSPGTHPPAYDAAHTGNALIPVWNAHGAAFAVSWPCTG